MNKMIVSAAVAALLMGGVAHATPPGNSNNSGDANATANAGASANAGAAAVAVNGPNTNTLVGGTNLNTLNGGDNRATATVGNTTATGGNAANTNVISVSPDIRNTTTNVNGQDQGQQQGQLQGQQQSNVGINGQQQSTSSGASSDQDQAQSLVDQSSHSASASTGASTSSASGNGAGQTTTLTQVYEAQKRAPVASAYAAPVAIGGGVCAYTPASGAFQAVSFGLSGGGAKIDKGCERRANADMFARLGMTKMSCELLMNNAEVAATARRIGMVCTDMPVAVLEPTPVLAPAAPTPLANELPAPVTPPEKGTERG
jgi:hypothetical protein